MISLNNISLMRGNQLLIADSSLTLSSGQRTGIIGRNGAGKTSLFKALEGEIPLEQGAVNCPMDWDFNDVSGDAGRPARWNSLLMQTRPTAHWNGALRQLNWMTITQLWPGFTTNSTTSRATAFATGLSSYFQDSASVPIYSIAGKPLFRRLAGKTQSRCCPDVSI